MTTDRMLIGLGAMGLPMARNLVAKQFRVQGFDMRERGARSAVARTAATAAPRRRDAAAAPTC